ncbi:hypothetical protein C8D88_1218 [Lentzea atacamensis]|uniref:Uncharacterized protein n=2 Tax=Lentzea TaxID=165301 RepID=A0A316HRB7_9PSEU|nr:hypothetical protein [Lentzea atacamensis]PWK80838.1 hypothetical protein C8D88_1218 [Lentzea atacamensis]RAS66683.1 hypothetical protein C8D87_10322 [Lentzea atacamensis]
MDLKPVADELYGLPPKEFTAARNTAAKQAGDKDLARAIADLRKPTVGAWAVNRLVRDAPKDLEEALSLSTAQLTMRELGRKRKELLESLVYRTLELTGPLADDAVTQVRNTLTAAMADPESAEQVRAGHLTKALEYSGFGFAVPVPEPVQEEGDGEDALARKRRERQERKRAEAQQALDEAEQALGEAQADQLAAQRAFDRAAERLEDAKRVTAAAEKARKAAERKLSDLS